MQIEELITTYCTAEKLPAYIRNRLHNNTETAPPPVSTYHGVEAVEDMLFTPYHEPEFPEKLKPQFWQELAETAKQAWDECDAEVFARAAHLCVRLGKPENLEPWKFFPRTANQFDWSVDADRVRIYTLAIWVLYSWGVRRQAFWGGVFDTLYEACRGEDRQTAFESLQGAIRHVWVALQPPGEGHWLKLFRLVMRRGKMAEELLALCLEGKWGACKDSEGCERALLAEVAAALEHLQASGLLDCQSSQGKAKAKAKAILKVLQAWAALPWRIPKADVERVVQPRLAASVSPRSSQPAWGPARSAYSAHP